LITDLKNLSGLEQA